MKKEVVMLDQYDVKENETPEIVADKHQEAILSLGCYDVNDILMLIMIGLNLLDNYKNIF